ncbi:MAG: hypothetical protein ACREXU_19645 [Gammaproteobacteria bacterium]
MRLPRGRIEPTGQARSNNGPHPGGFLGHLSPETRRWSSRTADSPPACRAVPCCCGVIASRACGRSSAAGGPQACRCGPISPVCLAVHTKGLSAPNGWPRSPDACTSLGCEEIALGDTIGAGTPLAACRVVEAAAHRGPLARIAVHFHDTRCQALANILACLGACFRYSY